HLPRGFSYEAWVKGLNEGRSFVSTGPMLIAQVDGKDPGEWFKSKSGEQRPVKVEATILSEEQVNSVEIILNGEVARRVTTHGSKNHDGAYEIRIRERVELTGSSWIALRCWEAREPGHSRFAHTAPWFFDVPGAPLRPRKEEAQFLVQRVREQIERSRSLLPA